MFEHSVKVPRHFKIASTILQKVIKDSCSLKTLLFGDNKYKHYRVDVLYALISEAVKHNTDLDEILTKTNILVVNPRLDPWLTKILAVELIYGKKALPGKSKPELTVLSYKDEFLKHIETPNHKIEEEKLKKARPRFIRVNTNLLTTSDAIWQFQDEGYKFIRCTSKSYNDYLKQLESLDQYQFIQDFHVKSVFAFAPRTKFFDHPFYLENKIVLQNKATTLAVHLLAPPPGSVVLDMCAAPGMKTTHVAAYMRNQGKVYAVERSEQRYKTLCDFVEKTGSTCVQPMLADILTIRRGQLDDVEYILLDPSCSGSGMDHNLHNYSETVRLARLTSLQEKLLKHAMSAFPKVKRIVYSTCSLYPEENERVVANTVTNCRVTWSVLNARQLLNNEWNNFGSGLYGFMGVRCLYARPENDYTTGFFVAALEKTAVKVSNKMMTDSESSTNENNDLDDEEIYNESEKVVIDEQEITYESAVNSNGDIDINLNELGYKKVTKKKRKKDEISNGEANNEFVDSSKQKSAVNSNGDIDINLNESGYKKATKKKHKKDKISNGEANNELVDGSKKKERKRKKEKFQENVEAVEVNTEEANNEFTETKRKKRKKDRGLNNEDYDEDVSKDESYSATDNAENTVIPLLSVLTLAESTDVDNGTTDNNEMRRKRKRKKDKTESNVVSDTLKDKKSKKNKNNSESIEFTGDGLVLSEMVLGETPMKKKKKKHDKKKIATQ